jgi:hypothetical protein
MICICTIVQRGVFIVATVSVKQKLKILIELFKCCKCAESECFCGLRMVALFTLFITATAAAQA